jgi:DNA-binding CsgD family transcriptional regulator
VARFKQLCCLGLGGEAVIPALLGELRAIIPSFGSTFFFADENGNLVNVFDENPESPNVVPIYLQEFYRRPDRIVGTDFAKALRTEFGVHSLEEVLPIDLSAYLRTDQYNLVQRPLGYDGHIRLVVRDGRHPRGAIILSRSLGERTFDADDRRRLGALETFFAYALAAKSPGEGPLVESDKSGLIIADQTGKTLHSSALGRRLLFLATHPRIGPDAMVRRQIPLPPALIRLCRSLAGVLSGDARSPAPTCHHRNVWGGFVFRAHWLEGPEPRSPLIGITVTYEEPVQTKMIRRIAELPLSPRQGQVCFLIASGSSIEDIASQLGISKHTANAHSRWIYNKLDVHSRTELVSKLLTC